MVRLIGNKVLAMEATIATLTRQTASQPPRNNIAANLNNPNTRENPRQDWLPVVNKNSRPAEMNTAPKS